MPVVKKFKFKDSDCWRYFFGSHKIFIPNAFIKEFIRWSKVNNYTVKADTTYNYKQSLRKKMDSLTLSMKEGRDFIIVSAEREPIIKWLKSQYKEIK